MIAILLCFFVLSSSVAGKPEQLNGLPGSARWQSFQTLAGKAEFFAENWRVRLNTCTSSVGELLSDLAIFHFSTRFSNFQVVSDADFSFYMVSHAATYLYLFNKHLDKFDRFHVFQTHLIKNDTHNSRGVHNLVKALSDEFERSDLLRDYQIEKEPISRISFHEIIKNHQISSKIIAFSFKEMAIFFKIAPTYSLCR